MIERFDGPADLARLLDEAYRLWGGDEDCEIYVFTDGPLPESRGLTARHVWIAPPAGDNAAIVALATRAPRAAHSRSFHAGQLRRRGPHAAREPSS